MLQGRRELRERNGRPLASFSAGRDAVVPTHAHMDHPGYQSLLLSVFLSACAAAPPADSASPYGELARTFTDQTPGWLPKGALDVVVLLQHPESEMLASAVVIAPDRLLTAAHVVGGLPRETGEVMHLTVEGRPTELRVVAQGDSEAAHGDWAILAADSMLWENVAQIHEPARSVDWSPALDTEVFLVGYAAGFFPERKINIDDPPPAIIVKIIELDGAKSTDAPAWLGKGQALHLGGMSGGAALVWNSTARRAELIGVFPGYIATGQADTTTVRFLGIPVSRRQHSRPSVAYKVHRLPEIIRQR